MNIINNYDNKKGIRPETKTNTYQINNLYKPDILDKISNNIKERDINKTVTMPKAIFKGYLYFTAGGALNTVSSILKNKKISKPLTIISSILTIAGTFNFVKPFLFSETEKKDK